MAKKFYGIDCQGEIIFPRGTAANRPAAGNEASVYWETDTERLFIDNATSWARVVLDDGQTYNNLTVTSSDGAFYS